MYKKYEDDRCNHLVSQMDISVRAKNALNNDNIIYIGDYISQTEQELLRIPFFGRKCFNEIKEILDTMGLEVGEKDVLLSTNAIDKINRRLDKIEKVLYHYNLTINN